MDSLTNDHVPLHDRKHVTTRSTEDDVLRYEKEKYVCLRFTFKKKEEKKKTMSLWKNRM